MTSWISVKDRLPEREETVLFTDGVEKVMGGFCDLSTCDKWHRNPCYSGFCFDTWKRDEITHWMPLPDLPKGESENEIDCS